MKKLWKRTSGLIKDRTSLLKASLTSRSTLRNRSIETAVIRATTHHETTVDYRSTQHVYAWVRISDDCLCHVLWALFRRMKRTRNWAVALKGLILLHGVFACDVPGIQGVGWLPSDLLNLKHTKHGKVSDLNTFIRAYYSFLDQKASFMSLDSRERVVSRDETNGEPQPNSVMEDLGWLQKLQHLLDALLEIQPKSSETLNALVLEAMDCVMIEVYDVCNRISVGIGAVLMRVSSSGKDEAIMTLRILRKAKVQHEEVSMFIEFCTDIGVGDASEFPKMEPIPEELIQELEDIVSKDSKQRLQIRNFQKDELESNSVVTNHKLIKKHDRNDLLSSLKAVITEDWEVFEELKKSKPGNHKFDSLPDLISL